MRQDGMNAEPAGAGDRATILAQYADGPTQLENAIKGVAESDLDMAPSQGGWSIREIVHHIADGDDIWKSCIKMALGNEQAEFHLDWYWAIPQTNWASSWAYSHRSVRSSLDLLKATRTHVLDLLAQRADAWERSVDIREPNGQITRVSVGCVVEMQADHVFHHINRILAIRQERGLASAGADVPAKMPSMQECEFVPYLSITDATKAVAFYTDVFGVAPHLLLNMPDGRVMHCEFRIGPSRFFISEELPEHGGTPSPTRLGATSVAIHLYVDDCDAMVERMKDSGSTVVMDPTDMFWGERFARVRDPFGHEWGVTTQLRDMSPEEIQTAVRRVFADMSE